VEFEKIMKLTSGRVRGIRRGVGEDTLAPSIVSNRLSGARIMRWEMPQAVDFRFGMEITMYIANR
jgi:coenzyme PQQ precursor peptide PqqA